MKRLDGGGLCLQATIGNDGINRNWIFRYELDGERHNLGLGPLHTIGLADAREKARAFRQQIINGIDPLQKREEVKRERLAHKADQARAITFKQCAEMFLNVHSKQWKNPIHIAQWTSTLETYADAVIGNLAVGDIDTAHLVKILEPLFHRVPEEWRRGCVDASSRISGTRPRLNSGLAITRRGGGDISGSCLVTQKRRLSITPPSPLMMLSHFVGSMSWPGFHIGTGAEVLILTTTQTLEAIYATWDR